MPERLRFVVTLTPLGGVWEGVPVARRLARLLRAAARSFGLRVESCRRVDAVKEETE